MSRDAAPLPVLLSVPHAGLAVPPEVAPYQILTPEAIEEDGDQGAAAIYALRREVAVFVSTDVARAFVDLNRPEHDRTRDGVVKTHTCWNVPVYEPFPPEPVVETLLARHHRPYHHTLTEQARSGVRLGIDGHTMASTGPPVGPDPGQVRPEVCLGRRQGATCPDRLFEPLLAAFERAFSGFTVTVDTPFAGGHIVRTHATELPWVQVEISRAPFLTDRDKRACVREALGRWSERRPWVGGRA